MDSLTKVCARCKAEKPYGDFYFRQGRPHSYCKACIKLTAQEHPVLPATKPKERSEVVVIDYLKSRGIPAMPGKALRYMHVDIVAFGCIRIEVKTGYPKIDKGLTTFKWNVSATQAERGILADLVLLVCEYGDRRTFHLFDVSNPVFYINGRLKSGFIYTVGAMEARKFGKTRVVMTQPMMDEAQDRVKLIHDELSKYISQFTPAA